MESNPTQREGERTPRARSRPFLAGDGPLVVGSVAFAAAAIVVYFAVVALGLHG